MINVSNILAPTDFSERCEYALTHAIELARISGAKIHLVHVLPTYIAPLGMEYAHDAFITIEKEMVETARAKIKKIEEQLQGLNIAFRSEILKGKAAEEILNYQDENNIDLIVIATHGASGLEHFLFGSTTEKVLRKSKSPVYVVKNKNN